MKEHNFLIEIETNQIDQIENDLKKITKEFQIAEQKNLDGNLPMYVVFFGASLKLMIDLLDYFLKFDTLVGKIRKIKTEDKTITDITYKELKELIDYYISEKESNDKVDN